MLKVDAYQDAIREAKVKASIRNGAMLKVAEKLDQDLKALSHHKSLQELQSRRSEYFKFVNKTYPMATFTQAPAPVAPVRPVSQASQTRHTKSPDIITEIYHMIPDPTPPHPNMIRSREQEIIEEIVNAPDDVEVKSEISDDDSVIVKSAEDSMNGDDSESIGETPAVEIGKPPAPKPVVATQSKTKKAPMLRLASLAIDEEDEDD